MDNYIPVLTKARRPLAPCHPNRAKSLVKAGKARFITRYGIRCIILNKTAVPKLKTRCRVQLRVKPGAAITGIAITLEHPDGSRSVLMAFQLEHRGKIITRALIKRRQRRQNRRYRKTRYRKPRFLNRTKPEGWLPPSIISRMSNTLTWVRRLSKILPVSDIHVETAVYDPALLRNPEIKGEEYQQGPLYQTNLRAAIFHRDGHKCVYCGKSGKRHRMELDHAIPQAQGGPDRYDNLLTACHDCNLKRNNQPLEVWLKHRPRKLAEVKAILGTSLAAATQLNAIIPRLLSELRDEDWTVTEHSAASTAAGRILCGVEKSRHADAAMTGCPENLRHMPEAPISIKATGRGNRQRIVPDKHGTPRGKGYREYCKLPKDIQKTTPTPSHKKRAKRVHGGRHRGLRPVYPQGNAHPRVRDHQQPERGTHQARVEERQGHPCGSDRAQPWLPSYLPHPKFVNTP